MCFFTLQSLQSSELAGEVCCPASTHRNNDVAEGIKKRLGLWRSHLANFAYVVCDATALAFCLFMGLLLSNYTFLSTSGSLSPSGSLSHTGRTFELPDKVPLTSPRFIEAISLMPESVAREHTCLALYEEGETLHVAYWQRDDIPTQDKLRFLLNYNIVFHHRSRRQIQKAIDHFYGKVEGESCDSILEEFTDTSIDFTETEPCDAKTSTRSLALYDDEEVDEFSGRIRR